MNTKTKTNISINEYMQENPLFEFLLTLQSITDDVKDALEELEESGQALRKGESAKPNIEAWKSAREVLTTAQEELSEVYATVLSAAPKSVQEEIGSGEDIDTSPAGIQALQAQMRNYLDGVDSRSARAACGAAMAAAEVMFRTQLAMAQQTYEAIESVASQARDMALQSAALVYQDTCMQAMEASEPPRHTTNGKGKRTLQ